jgi:hypothetical protein
MRQLLGSSIVNVNRLTSQRTSGLTPVIEHVNNLTNERLTHPGRLGEIVLDGSREWAMVTARSSESQAAPDLLPGRVTGPAGKALYLAASEAERLNARGGTVRPGAARRVLVKREPGFGKPGQTGAAARQRTAAA